MFSIPFSYLPCHWCIRGNAYLPSNLLNIGKKIFVKYIMLSIFSLANNSRELCSSFRCTVLYVAIIMTFLVLFWEHNAHPRGRQTITSMIQGRRSNLREGAEFSWIFSISPMIFSYSYLLEVTFLLKSLEMNQWIKQP